MTKKFRIGQHVRVGSIQPGADERSGYVVHRSATYCTIVPFTVRPCCSYVIFEEDWHRLSPTTKPDARVIAASRGDYTHFAVIVGRRMTISAGCRHFTTAKQALAHWTGRERRSWAYDKTTRRYSVRGTDLGRQYDGPKAVKVRAKDAALNKWSIAFVRKAERIRAKN